jgi:ankyrin repeat protein
MEKSLDPNILDRQNRTLLGWAACQGDVGMVEWLLTRRGIQVNAANENEQPTLWLAARHGHIHVVQRLLECKNIDIIEDGMATCHHCWLPSLQATRIWPCG